MVGQWLALKVSQYVSFSLPPLCLTLGVFLPFMLLSLALCLSLPFSDFLCLFLSVGPRSCCCPSHQLEHHDCQCCPLIHCAVSSPLLCMWVWTIFFYYLMTFSSINTSGLVLDCWSAWRPKAILNAVIQRSFLISWLTQVIWSKWELC